MVTIQPSVPSVKQTRPRPVIVSGGAAILPYWAECAGKKLTFATLVDNLLRDKLVTPGKGFQPTRKDYEKAVQTRMNTVRNTLVKTSTGKIKKYAGLPILDGETVASDSMRLGSATPEQTDDILAQFAALEQAAAVAIAPPAKSGK